MLASWRQQRKRQHLRLPSLLHRAKTLIGLKKNGYAKVGRAMVRRTFAQHALRFQPIGRGCGLFSPMCGRPARLTIRLIRVAWGRDVLLELSRYRLTMRRCHLKLLDDRGEVCRPLSGSGCAVQRGQPSARRGRAGHLDRAELHAALPGKHSLTSARMSSNHKERWCGRRYQPQCLVEIGLRFGC